MTKHVKMTWSTQNPTSLLHILPLSSVRLIETKGKSKVDYTALSFRSAGLIRARVAKHFQRTSSTAANYLLLPWISLRQFEMPSNPPKNVGLE